MAINQSRYVDTVTDRKSASDAAASAKSAATSASSASSSATKAAASELAAAASASAAAQSELSAAASELSAENSAIAAASSASDSEASATRSEDSATDAELSASEAAQSANVAQSAANYQGIWSDLGAIAGVVGGTYFHDSAIWLLKESLPDISSQEPSIGSDYWYRINGGAFVLSAQPSLVIDHVKQKYEVYQDAESGIVKSPYGDIIAVERDTGVTVNDRVGGVSEISPDKIAYAFDPETGENLGAQLAEGGENLIEWSEDLTNWTISSGIDIPSTYEKGGFNVSEISSSSTNVNTGVNSSSIDVETDETYTVSVFVDKSNHSESIGFVLKNFAGSWINGYCNLSTGESRTIDCDFLDNGDFYEIRFSYVSSVDSQSGVIVINPRDGSGSYSNEPLGVTAVQVTKTAYPLPYIKTEGATVTTGSDSMYRTIGNELNRNAFTMYSEFQYSGDYDQSTGLTSIASLSDSQSTVSEDSIGFVKYTNSSKLRLNLRKQSTSYDLYTSQNLDLSGSVRTAVSYGNGSVVYAVYCDETLLSGTIELEVENVPEYKYLTFTKNMSGNSAQMYGVRYDKRHLLYPVAYTQTELEQLVTQGAENVTYA